MRTFIVGLTLAFIAGFLLAYGPLRTEYTYTYVDGSLWCLESEIRSLSDYEGDGSYIVNPHNGGYRVFAKCRF